MGSSILLLILTLAACGGSTNTIGTDPGHNLDGTDDGNTTTGTDETIAVAIETSLEGTAIDGISFDINGPESFSAETTYEDNLLSGEYTVSNVSGTFNGANFISCGDANLDESSSAINIPLSFDFSGTSWTCGEEEDAITVSDTCQVDVEGISTDFELDGLTLTVQSSHWTAVGTIATDFQSINFVTTYDTDGSTDELNCPRE